MSKAQNLCAPKKGCGGEFSSVSVQSQSSVAGGGGVSVLGNKLVH